MLIGEKFGSREEITKEVKMKTGTPKTSTKLPAPKSMKATDPAKAKKKSPPSVKILRKSVDGLVEQIEKALPILGAAAAAAKPIAAKIAAGAGKAGAAKVGAGKAAASAAPKLPGFKETATTAGAAGLGGRVGWEAGGIGSKKSIQKAAPVAAKVAGKAAAKLAPKMPGFRETATTAGAAGLGGRVGWEAGKPGSKKRKVADLAMSKGLGSVLGGGLGAVIGSPFGPGGAALGSMAGHGVGGAVSKDKGKKKVCKSRELAGAGLGGAIGSAGGPVTAGLGAMAGHTVAGATRKKSRPSTTVTKKAVDLDLLKSHAQASLKVEKAIYYLQGYEPMSDNLVKKSFHGQIPDVMKELEFRPPKTWWDKAIAKASRFDPDPIRFTLGAWYGNPDVKKAVAEKIGSKYGPELRGEDDQISDGSRLSTRDLTEDKKSEELVTN